MSLEWRAAWRWWSVRMSWGRGGWKNGLGSGQGVSQVVLWSSDVTLWGRENLSGVLGGEKHCPL